ncbi:DUF5825 family protein [Polymorphospora rubra]|uniref:Uncharacterized protein n=1 Tax=Polymorphospora rubra TaxID=338584 RepID=A0A810N4P1_9ACTN|nr:DUF5825 family protein [Polymorphospora rubra]BCJ66708.1 hypothetical protein Prubr_37290 [Polymorphospora rubra]
MPSTDTDLRPIPVGLARDHDPAVITVPGIDIGPAELREPAADAVARWRRDGVRKVVLPDPVDLTVAGADAEAVDTVRRLVLVRELTSHGIAVDWRLRLPGDDDQEWLPYGHLRPPLELLPPPTAIGADPAQQLAAWHKAFYFDKCTYRRGPGFVQVRDRRSGRLNLITIDDPAYLAVLDQLMDGAELTDVDLGIARDFGEEGLVTKVGDLLVWLPYRLRRWPLPSMVV